MAGVAALTLSAFADVSVDFSDTSVYPLGSDLSANESWSMWNVEDTGWDIVNGGVTMSTGFINAWKTIGNNSKIYTTDIGDGASFSTDLSFTRASTTWAAIYGLNASTGDKSISMYLVGRGNNYALGTDSIEGTFGTLFSMTDLGITGDGDASDALNLSLETIKLDDANNWSMTLTLENFDTGFSTSYSTTVVNDGWNQNELTGALVKGASGSPVSDFVVSSYDAVAIPEPATIGLLSLGSIGLFVLRRRRAE